MAIKLSPEQQKAIEEQKANCPFCRIVKGDIPSKKAYEDDDVQAIMDINPASKGHMLVMPKEHYPIMPLIPDKTFEHLFSVTQRLCGVAQQAMLVPGSTVFIANGAAAGQQSQHFMLHIIPREDHDHLSTLDAPSRPVDMKGIEKLHTDLRNNLAIMMRNHLQRRGRAFPEQVMESMTPEGLIALIEANSPMLELLLKRPEEFKRLIPKHPQLSVMFRGKDVDAIIETVLKKHGVAGKAPAGEPEKHEASEDERKAEEGHGEKVSLDDIAKLFGGR